MHWLSNVAEKSGLRLAGSLSMPPAVPLAVAWKNVASAYGVTEEMLAATGSGTEGAEVHLMDEGADDYIEKPLDPQRFTARIKAALRRANS